MTNRSKAHFVSPLKIAVAIRIPDQHDSAGRVLSIHVYESSPPIEEDYGHIGYKGRGPIQVLSLFPLSGAARNQVIETLPAPRIRRTALRTSASNRGLDQNVIAPYVDGSRNSSGR